MDAKSDTNNLPALARERVRVGPVPDWVTPNSYNPDFDPQVRGATTCLLIVEQVHAELGATHVRMVVRLETMQSVQLHSQWRLEFEPQTQTITLHSIKIRRGSSETEHGAMERIQFLQREADLEGFTIDGWITLLLLLEDVRPDDILEWSYTVTNRPRLLPGHVSRFFSLPAGAEVGKYHFSVCHAESRGLKWIASSPDLSPKITTDGSDLLWLWAGEKITTPEPEACTPSWQLDFPWIQISDCPDWQTVARALSEGWEEVAGAGLGTFVAEIQGFSSDPLVQVNRAIELVQDGFRYLSVNLKLGGQIPASTETVIRRRYGDCKDMAFLLAQTLRALGIAARPVLVDTYWQKSLATLLPSPNAFNHVIVEYQIGGEKRWVDATHKSQGGGALKRSITDFGVGLPIDPTTTVLATVPNESLPSGTYELKESFLLDTAGQSSFFAQVTTATGDHANSLRWEFANEGVDAVAKKRLQACANRFSSAIRVGPLQHRDNREANEFVVAEAFEVTGFLKEDRKSNTCPFLIQSDLTNGMLVSPGLAPRRNPFAIPFPCQLTYTVEIDFTGFNPAAMPPFNAKSKFFNFTRRTKALPKFFKVIFSLETLTHGVPPDRLAEHRKQVESVWQESALWIHFPVGYARMRKRSDFGALPSPLRTSVAANPEPPRPPTAITVPLRPVPPESAPVVVELQPQITKTAITTDCPAASQPPAPSVASSNPTPAQQGSSPTPSPYRRRGMNRRCLLSFYFALGAFALFVVGAIVDKTWGANAIGGFTLILCMLAVAGAIILGISGWKECVQPPRKPQRGRSAAAAGLVLGGLLGLILLPVMITGFTTALKYLRSQNQSYGSGETLKFDGMNFAFRSPRSPWSQADARALGGSTILAYTRPGPMIFAVNISHLEAGYPDPLTRAIEMTKTGYRVALPSYQPILEGKQIHNGILGWQIEARGEDEGRDIYFMQWILVTNGFAYQLSIWGPMTLKPQIKDEADPLFSNFQPTASKL